MNPARMITRYTEAERLAARTEAAFRLAERAGFVTSDDLARVRAIAENEAPDPERT